MRAGFAALFRGTVTSSTLRPSISASAWTLTGGRGGTWGTMAEPGGEVYREDSWHRARGTQACSVWPGQVRCWHSAGNVARETRVLGNGSKQTTRRVPSLLCGLRPGPVNYPALGLMAWRSTRVP